MDLDDDIGCFGLLPATSRSSSASRKRSGGGGTGTRSETNTKRTQGKRRLSSKSSSKDDSSDSSSSSSDEDEGMALAQLAQPARQGKSSAAGAAATATVTPVFSQSSRRPASSSKPDQKKSVGNKKSAGGSNPPKQRGIQSFFGKGGARKISPSSDGASSNEPSSEASTENNGQSRLKASGDARGNKKRPHSFMTASTALNNGVGAKESSDEHTRQPSILSKQNTPAVHDELEEFSDDDEHNTCTDAAAVSQNQNEDVDDGIDEGSNHRLSASSFRAETREEKLARMRQKHNSLEFGIHDAIFGHALPSMGHAAKSRAADDHMGGTASHAAQRHPTRLLHGHSGVNLLSHLFQRTCRSSTPRNRSKLHRFAHAGRHWNACDTVELGITNDGTRVGGEVCAMSFDREGVLLATGDDRGSVQIYDFDDVAHLDATTRNRRCKSMWKSCEDVASEEHAKAGVEEGVVDMAGDSDEADEAAEVVREAGDATPPSIEPAVLRPVLSFQCRARPGGNVGPRISSVQWCPQNQDYLAVSFANQQEVHLYDVASTDTPLPCLRLAEAGHSRSEGVLKTIFLPSSTKASSIHLLTGGNYGTVRLWSIPGQRPQQQSTVGSLNAKCLWSISAFGEKGEGVCEMMALPTSAAKPLVLLAGCASSLALLDTNRCTRKAFSTTTTPTVAASWDLYHLAQREYAKIDSEAKFPARRWMAAHQLTLLGQERTNGVSWFKIGLVVKCGWVFVGEFGTPSSSANCDKQPQLRLRIVHHTPRVQCFNSSNERVTTLGGMALQFCLPDVPVPSATYGRSPQDMMLWLCDVKPRRYNMPSKDKYVLCQEHGTISFELVKSHGNESLASPTKKLRHPGEGLVLARLDSFVEAPSAGAGKGDEGAGQEGYADTSICARLPLPQGTPLSLASHPSGEWLIVGYGMNGRGPAARPLEIVSMRKSF